jgi:hypothetical protein
MTGKKHESNKKGVKVSEIASSATLITHLQPINRTRSKLPTKRKRLRDEAKGQVSQPDAMPHRPHRNDGGRGRGRGLGYANRGGGGGRGRGMF